MYCKHCGKQITEDSSYCQYCGGKQDDSSTFGNKDVVNNTSNNKVDSSTLLSKGKKRIDIVGKQNQCGILLV